MIFADADFFIGYLNKHDLHHEKCIKLAKEIEEEILTSWDVVDEVTTKLSYFVSKDRALRFIQRVIEEKITIVYPSLDLLISAKEIFKNQTSGKISLTDCMNMAIAKEKKIRDFLSFDKIYTKNGFKLYGQ